jgi:hypothetical protein
VKSIIGKEKGASAMKHVKIFFLLLPAVLMAPMISANQPMQGSGTFTPASPPTILDTRVADGNTLITAMQPFTVVGTLLGTEVLTFHEVIHPNGTVDIQSFGVFTGTVTWIMHRRIPTCAPFDAVKLAFEFSSFR